MSQFSTLFRKLSLLTLIFKLNIWFQHGKFTMNSQYPKLGDRHFKEIDSLPLHLKNKLHLYSRFVLSKVSWNFTCPFYNDIVFFMVIYILFFGTYTVLLLFCR